MHGNLVVEFDQGRLPILPHIEPDRNNRPALMGHGVDILNPFDLPQETLQGGCHKLFHLLGSSAGGLDINVGQGDDNLGVLLPGRDHNGCDSQANGNNQENNRRPAIEKRSDNAGNQATGGVNVIPHFPVPLLSIFPRRRARTILPLYPHNSRRS